MVLIHPGVTMADIQTATGFAITASPALAPTPLPLAEELRLIRTEIDPLGMRRLEFVAGKDRVPLLAALIESEEAAIAAITGIPAGAGP